MRAALRILAILACLATIAQTIALHRATGSHAFTAYPHPDVAEMKAHEGQMSAMFHDETLDGPVLVKDPISNDFALGWLPGGWGKHAVSVLTLTAPLLVVLGALVVPCKSRRAVHADSKPPERTVS